jgi:hypothetical protein
MKAHAELKNLLKCEKTRIGLDKKLQIIPDVILFIKPGYRALNQGHCFTIALEIKEFKDDLMRDEKLWKYVGWTDFFFIAVLGFTYFPGIGMQAHVFNKCLYLLAF